MIHTNGTKGKRSSLDIKNQGVFDRVVKLGRPAQPNTAQWAKVQERAELGQPSYLLAVFFVAQQKTLDQRINSAQLSF